MDAVAPEDVYAGLVESAPDAMVVVDAQGTIVLVNAQTERLFGYDRAELLGQPVEVLLPEAVRAAHVARRSTFAEGAHARAMGTGLELSGRRQDGREFPVEVSLSTLRTSRGTLISSAIRDVSDRKRLEAMSAHLTAVIESSEDAIIGMDLDGKIVSWNPGAERLYGYREAEVRGQPIELLVPHGLEDEIPGLLARIAGGERVDHLEAVRRRRDGSLVDVVLTISGIRDGHGRLVGASTIARNVTERRAAERALADACRDVDQFFALSLDLMAIFDPNGRVLWINRTCERILGWSPPELVSRRFVELIHPDDLQATLDLHAAGRADKGGVVGFENRYRHKDGSWRWLAWNYGKLEGGMIFATARDITERRRIEQDLRASREAALEASRLKSEFVANMSHEIRTPLNGVVCMSELLLEQPLTAEQHEYAQVALSSAEALMRVINDILDFSKIEAGKLDIVSEDFSIEAAVGEVCEILAGKAHEKGLELATSIDESVPRVVRGDSNRLRQVLMNLVGNALKFTTEGEVVVRVRRTAGVWLAEGLVFEVVDTGIGIDAARIDALFQPFSQGDATTTRRHGGTGLGLCISKQLVELMGGTITVESRPGEGSTFRVTLPCVRGVEAEPDPVAFDLTGHRFLIVDPNAISRQGLARQLAEWGLDPDGASCADQALSLLHRAANAGRPYQGALIDIHTPGPDGLGLARTIKSTPRLRSTRLIVLSSSPARRSEAAAAGVDAELAKPVRPSRLHDEIVAALRRRIRAAPPEAPVRPASAAAQLGKVLVAEDNEVNRFAAIRLLQKLGFDVDTARNGAEAIAMSARGDYAAIFMDCQMPEVDGYVATERIRRRERDGEHTPIIAMTANALEGDREKCLAVGMDDYMSKPLRLATVTTLIERYREPPVHAPAAIRLVIPGPGEAVFDQSPLREIGDPETEQLLATMFLEQARERLPQIADAIATDDPERLRELAHGLKGSAATVGAVRIRDLCQTLCTMAADRAIAGAENILAQVAAALEATAAALGSYTQAA